MTRFKEKRHIIQLLNTVVLIVKFIVKPVILFYLLKYCYESILYRAEGIFILAFISGLMTFALNLDYLLHFNSIISYRLIAYITCIIQKCTYYFNTIISRFPPYLASRIKRFAPYFINNHLFTMRPLNSNGDKMVMGPLNNNVEEKNSLLGKPSRLKFPLVFKMESSGGQGGSNQPWGQGGGNGQSSSQGGQSGRNVPWGEDDAPVYGPKPGYKGHGYWPKPKERDYSNLPRPEDVLTKAGDEVSSYPEYIKGDGFSYDPMLEKYKIIDPNDTAKKGYTKEGTNNQPYATNLANFLEKHRKTYTPNPRCPSKIPRNELFDKDAKFWDDFVRDIGKEDASYNSDINRRLLRRLP